jgi:REP element-mobilizing transposase RayT
MAKFKNKYRIESARFPKWNYGWNGAYFITICTKNREMYFGEIDNGKMNLTEIGKIAHQYLLEIPDHFPFVKLGEFMVMPNHVHAIIIIDKPHVETKNFAFLSIQPGQPSPPQAINQPSKTKNQFGPQSQNLGSIVRGFKTGVKKFATMHNIDFAWQSRFHDHIIRNKPEYNRIEKYIIDNPTNWGNDKFHK